MEKDGNVLVIKRIHVTYDLLMNQDKKETAVRAHDIHADYCPVARSIRDSIDITTELNMRWS